MAKATQFWLLLLVAATTMVTAHHPNCEEAIKTCQHYNPDEADQCVCVDCNDDSGEKCWMVSHETPSNRQRRLGTPL